MKFFVLHIFSIHSSSRHEKGCRMLQRTFWLFQCSRNQRWTVHLSDQWNQAIYFTDDAGSHTVLAKEKNHHSFLWFTITLQNWCRISIRYLQIIRSIEIEYSACCQDFPLKSRNYNFLANIWSPSSLVKIQIMGGKITKNLCPFFFSFTNSNSSHKAGYFWF